MADYNDKDEIERMIHRMDETSLEQFLREVETLTDEEAGNELAALEVRAIQNETD